MFRSVNQNHLASFNSANASELIDAYKATLEASILEKRNRVPNPCFVASSFRCDRRSWFRIRGVHPDVPKTADTALQFTADVGTALHRVIQKILKKLPNAKWVDVSEYVFEHISKSWLCESVDEGLETQVKVPNPPFQFSCDGMLEWKGTNYLIEIKSTEFSTWNNLTNIKDEHIDQVRCYAHLLRLDHVFVIYIDRQYGGMKVYEYTMTQADHDLVYEKIHRVLDCVKSQIAPDPLPAGDKWCSEAMCPYFKKCKEYGR